jgi:hypothetical protein
MTTEAQTDYPLYGPIHGISQFVSYLLSGSTHADNPFEQYAIDVSY